MTMAETEQNFSLLLGSSSVCCSGGLSRWNVPVMNSHYTWNFVFTEFDGSEVSVSFVG